MGRKKKEKSVFSFFFHPKRGFIEKNLRFFSMKPTMLNSYHLTRLFIMRYSNLLLSVCLVIFTTIQSSCKKNDFDSCIHGEGTIETQFVELEKPINYISLASTGTLIVKQGKEQLIEIRAHANVIEHLVDNSRIKNGHWKISLGDCEEKIRKEELEIFVTLPTLIGLALSRDGDVKTDGVFEDIEELKLIVAGSGNMEVRLGNNVHEVNTFLNGNGDLNLTLDDQADKVKTFISDYGDCTLAGSTEMLEIFVRGKGNVKALDLSAKDCNINTDETGDCEVRVENELNVIVSSSGNVCYRGQPKVTVEMDTDGSGEVKSCN